MLYIFQIMLGLVTPVFALLFSPLYNSQKSQLIVISAFITVVFVFFKPLDGFDLLVHYQNFTDYQAGQYELFNRYIGVDVLIYCISLIGLGENTLVFITSFMLFYSTYRFVESHVPENKLLITFLLIVSSYPLVLLISGVRFSLALSFFLLSDVYFTKKYYARCFIFFGLSILMHYAASFLVFLYVLSNFIKVERINSRLFFCFFILMLPVVLYQDITIQVVSFVLKTIGFEQYVGLDLSRYVSGEWGAMRSISYNINGLLGYFVPKMLLCFIGFIYLLKNGNKNSFIIMLFAVVSLLINFGDIGDRYAICLVPFLISALITSMGKITIRTFPPTLVVIVCFALLNVFKELLLYHEVYMNLFFNTLYFYSPMFTLIGSI